MRRILGISLLTALVLAGCNSAGCLDNGSTLPLAKFYSSATAAAVAIDSLQIQGIGAPGDSILVQAGSATSQAYMPLRPDQPSTSWVFSYKQGILANPAFNDTLTFTYQTIPYFASEECGAMYIYRIESLTHTTHLIDSVLLTDQLFTNVEAERIKIYFRTAQEEPSR
ncbi:MAG: hypothetical protein K1V80_02765 [Muribaculaceae bacterium]